MGLDVAGDLGAGGPEEEGLHEIHLAVRIAHDWIEYATFWGTSFSEWSARKVLTSAPDMSVLAAR